MSEATRRELVGRAALLAGGALLAAPALARAQNGTLDVAVIETLIHLKQADTLIYERLAAAPRLDGRTRSLLGRFASLERDHAAALLRPALYLGAKPVSPPVLATVESLLPGLRTASGKAAVLELANRVERSSLQTLVRAQAQLDDAKLNQVVGEVSCCDAQQLAVIRSETGRDPIPDAFEAGQSR